MLKILLTAEYIKPRMSYEPNFVKQVSVVSVDKIIKDVGLPLGSYLFFFYTSVIV